MNIFEINDFIRENLNFSILCISSEFSAFCIAFITDNVSVFAGRDPLVQSYALEISRFTG